MTGRPVWPIVETPVPASDVPGEKASPTQPIPSKPAPYEYQGVAIDDLADFTPEIRAAAIKAIEPFRYGPLFTPPYSRITAINMNTGNHAWMVPAGNGDRIRNNPRLKGLNLPPVGGDSTFSGPLLTKTLLMDALTTGGSTDGPRLVAYDKTTGKELASVDLPGAAIGTPMTYSVGGKQYVALTVQGATPTAVPELVALALP